MLFLEKFTPMAKILHCSRQWRHGQISPLQHPYTWLTWPARIHQKCPHAVLSSSWSWSWPWSCGHMYKRVGSFGIILIYLVLQTIIILYAELRRQQLCVNITFMSAELRIGVKNPGRFPAKLTRPNVVPDLIMMLVAMRLVAMMTCLVR